jgi:Uma2 family endonuclease
MVTQLPTQTAEIIYPDSDGQPMADNTLQYRWIVTIQGGLDTLFKDDPNVFVAGDLLWYPVEGNNVTRRAPDVMVAIGRPKGDRGSYQQWREENIPPQVVFEILSPGNSVKEMVAKHNFYRRYGVEEYYLYDPDNGDLTGWIRDGEELPEIEQMLGWISPRLGIRFELSQGELEIYRPDGEKFVSYVELARQKELVQQELAQEKQRAEQAEEELQTLRALLAEKGINPDEL